MGFFVVVCGIGLLIVGWVIVVIHAFQHGILWGLGSLLIPVVLLIFAILNWDEAKTGGILYTIGVALIIVGVQLPALK